MSNVTGKVWNDLAKEQEENLAENFLKYIAWLKKNGKTIPPWDYDPINDREHTLSYGERMKRSEFIGPFTKEWW